MRHLQLGIVFVVLAIGVPSLSAQQHDSEFKGEGAAMCIAAGEFLASTEHAPIGVSEDIERWRQVMHVVEGAPDVKERAIAASRRSFIELETQSPGLGALGARGIWDSSGCSDEMQIRYIAVHGSEQRARLNLAEDPSMPLDEAAAERLFASASCLAAAELFSSKRPKARLRQAISQAAPAAPERARLKEIQKRAENAILTSEGSSIGKALLIEYMQYLYGVASGGESPQQFVNDSSNTLNSRCLEEQTEPTDG